MVRRVLVLMLDVVLMVACFSALTLFPALSSYIAHDMGIGREMTWWISILFAAGVFASYAVGALRIWSGRPRAVVVSSTLLVALSLLLSAAASNPLELAALRFVQGFASMAVPVFSAQIGAVLGDLAPLALGVLFASTFFGGFLGFALSSSLAPVVGWRGVYAVAGLIVLAALGLWSYGTPRETLAAISARRDSSKSVPKFWRDPFTLLWGASFFPAMWILFTVSTTLPLALRHWGPETAFIAGEELQLSLGAWSIVAGALTTLLIKRGANPISAIARVQGLCLAMTFAASMTIASAKDPIQLYTGVAMLGAVQGASPAFWSLPSFAYPREVSDRAGFVLGMISNSAAMIGPAISTIVATSSIAYLWVSLSIAAIGGAALTAVANTVAPPISMHVAAGSLRRKRR